MLQKRNYWLFFDKNLRNSFLCIFASMPKLRQNLLTIFNFFCIINGIKSLKGIAYG